MLKARVLLLIKIINHHLVGSKWSQSIKNSKITKNNFNKKNNHHHKIPIKI